MKKLLLLSVLLGVCAVNLMAQDDLYFTPKKSEKAVKSTKNVMVDDNTPAYHVGTNRSADEYNRRGKFGSYYEKIGTDSLGNDIIEFHPAAEDSLAAYTEADKKYDVDEDYSYSRRMSRFDDFYWYDPWFFGPYYGWHSPWWYSHWGWYDPWYYGWGYNGWYGWYDWYDPYYYSFYGWRYPYYWGLYPSGWYYTRPYYIATTRVTSPGNSISTDRYYRGYNTARHNGGYGYSTGTANSRNWGNYSSSGNYSSGNVNRGYRRDTPTFSGNTGGTRSSGSYSGSSGSYSGGSHVGNRSSGSYSAPATTRSSSSGSYSAPSSSRSSGGFSGGGGGGGGGSHRGRR